MKSAKLPAACTMLLVFLWVGSAEAIPIRNVFSVTATSGPLSGERSAGFFVFDSEIIPPGGGDVLGLDLIIDLGFSWNGKLYDETNTSTGSLTFDVTGTLVAWEFGTACAPNPTPTVRGCALFIGEHWVVAHSIGTPDPEQLSNFFSYGIDPIDFSFGVGTSTVQSLPEPGSLGLMVTGLTVLSVRRWRRLGVTPPPTH